jgi:SAM-dependent methyltransferase
MKNSAAWVPSKFVHRNGRLTASRDPSQVGVGSRLIADLIAEVYDRHIPRFCRGRLVDLGCGQVPLYGAYKTYIADATCVDWPNSAHEKSYIDVECDLAQRLPFENGTFETVVLSDVLEHVPEPEALWKEMGRILVGGGRVLLNVPFYYWLHETPHDYYRYTEYALRRFATLGGFKVLVLEPLGGVPEVLADIVGKVFVERVPLVGKPFASLLQSITRGFIRTRLGRKVSEATSHQFPLGYFLVAEKTAAGG